MKHLSLVLTIILTVILCQFGFSGIADPLDTFDDLTIHGWSASGGEPEFSIVTEGLGSMGIPNGTTDKTVTGTFSPTFDLTPTGNWAQVWVYGNGSRNLLQWNFTSPGQTSAMRKDMTFADWLPWVVQLSNFTNMGGSVVWSNIDGAGFILSSDGINHSKIYLDDMRVLTSPTLPAEVDYMETTRLLPNAERNGSWGAEGGNITVSYDTAITTVSEGQTSLHFVHTDTSPGSAVKNDSSTVLGATNTIRSFRPFEKIHLDIFGDNSGAVLNFQYISSATTQFFSHTITVNFSGLQSFEINRTSIPGSGGAVDSDWDSIDLLRIAVNGVSCDVHIDNWYASPTPPVTAVDTNWMFFNE